MTPTPNLRPARYPIAADTAECVEKALRATGFPLTKVSRNTEGFHDYNLTFQNENVAFGAKILTEGGFATVYGFRLHGVKPRSVSTN